MLKGCNTSVLNVPGGEVFASCPKNLVMYAINVQPLSWSCSKQMGPVKGFEHKWLTQYFEAKEVNGGRAGSPEGMAPHKDGLVPVGHMEQARPQCHSGLQQRAAQSRLLCFAPHSGADQ